MTLIPFAQAAQGILKGVAEKQAIIVVSDALRTALTSGPELYRHHTAIPSSGQLTRIANEGLDNLDKGIFTFQKGEDSWPRMYFRGKHVS